jgi:hypothetical protein
VHITLTDTDSAVLCWGANSDGKYVYRRNPATVHFAIAYLERCGTLHVYNCHFFMLFILEMLVRACSQSVLCDMCVFSR